MLLTSVNQRLPSAPTASEPTEIVGEGKVNRWNVPSRLIWPSSLCPPVNLGAWSTLGASLPFPWNALNQSFPSRPKAISRGYVLGVVKANRWNLPSGVSFPTAPLGLSVVKFSYATAGNHRLPSGPSTICPGRLYGAGTCNRFSLP